VNNLNCSDQDLLAFILLNNRTGEHNAYKCIKKNYSNKFRGTLRKFGVRNDEDMIDIELEAMAALFFNILSGKYKAQSGICTYFISIGINKWRKVLRNRGKGKMNSSRDSNDESFSAKFQAYLNNDLEENERQEMKQLLANDTDLQEMLEMFRKPNYVEVEMEQISIPYEEVEEQDTQEMIELIKQKFPPDSTCVETLTAYYFQYEANYLKMAHAIKRRVEEVETVYERIRRQVNRCLEKIKK